MILDGLTLMFVGMSVVFLVLTIMVGAVKASAAVIGRYFPEKVIIPLNVSELEAAAVAAAFHKNKIG